MARAGATARAWALFEAAGWLMRDSDPAALSLKGRLLKDRARQHRGAERAGLFADAAAAYAAAHALSPAPYRAINVATARLLSGDPKGASDGARAVLALLDDPGAAADTPYYIAATRAEALLLLGDDAGARAAMADAVAADPDGWDDRAVTLAQLNEIAATQGLPTDWLTGFSPPASLHFAGHMGLSESGPGATEVAAATDVLIARHRIGFAWGALAAGADIVVAERLVAAGVELHAVLPCPVAAFKAQSVAPAGAGWIARFEALLDRAATLRIAGYCAAGVHDPLATAHAGHLAIGGALLNARRYAAPAVQWLIEDEQGGGANTARQAAAWPGPAGPQERLRVAREVAVEALFPLEAPDPARRLVWHLAISLDLPEESAGSAAVRAATEPVGKALAGVGLTPGEIRVAPGQWAVTSERSEAILTAVAALLALPQPGPALGLHRGIALVLTDPATGADLPYAPDAALAVQLAAMAPPGTALCSDALAVGLAAEPLPGWRSELYHPGEAETAGAVHLLLPAGQ